MMVETGNEGTSCWICRKCLKPCDPESTQSWENPAVVEKYHKPKEELHFANTCTPDHVHEPKESWEDPKRKKAMTCDCHSKNWNGTCKHEAMPTCGKCHEEIETGDTFYRLHAGCMDFSSCKHSKCQNCGNFAWPLDQKDNCAWCVINLIGGSFMPVSEPPPFKPDSNRGEHEWD